MAHFNPKRLTVARMRRALTKVGLAVAADISPRSISNYERGTQAPTQKMQERLATILEFPVGFWSGDDLAVPEVEGGHFRAPTNLSARSRDRVRATAAIANHLWNWVDQRIRVPQSDIVPLIGIDAEAAADSLRIEWHLGTNAAPNMIHLAEAHGIRIFSLPPDCEYVDAFSFWLDGEPFIFLDMAKSAERRRWDVAHEIGHLVMHRQMSGSSGNRQHEHEANQFASSFLMPRSSVIASMSYEPTLEALISGKRMWGVSVAALAYRMHDLELLSEWQYRSHFIQMSRLGYRRSEPEPIAPEMSSLWSQVFEVLADNGISVARMSGELELRPIDVRELTFLPALARDNGPFG